MRNNFLAPELKRMVDHGTRREKPARTKNVATKPSHGGPVESAKKEKTAARTREINPLRHHAGEGLTELSKVAPRCNARTGSRFAAACAGSQAEITTEAKPITQASKNVHGFRTTC